MGHHEYTMNKKIYFTKDDFREDSNPVIQRALRVLEDSKIRQIPNRQIIFIKPKRYPVYIYDDIHNDIALSERRRRKLQKEIEKIENEYYGIYTFKKNCDAKLNNISTCVREIDAKISKNEEEKERIAKL